ncbi:BAR-domain-containing protein [Gonapodya prolifera JEL478]|uniref:BAR-domain-containing protein n=1 Tax=Gonapodya prolifera (strain JEL478) TaxID=1344416 RepID=A0A138ZZR9_GONPJ|nr:BAR-domain-containing protein [Gonapodya prolifera JEL478]|eukprot:KXS09633.1 BAR-domain-containing protein [Gonapodya prolifera JEL478]
MSWAGFKKAINRGIGQIQVSAGLVEKTTDPVYDAEEKRFKSFEARLLKFQKEAKSNLDSMRAVTLTQRTIAEACEALYDDPSQGNGYAALKYKEVSTKIDEEGRKEFDDAYRVTVYEPVTTLSNSVSNEFNACMDKRRKKLLDYDLQKAKVRKLVEKPSGDAGKLPRNEAKLTAVRTHYESLNTLLITDIPNLLSQRHEILDPSVEALIKANLQFWRAGAARLREVEKKATGSDLDLGNLGKEGVVEEALEQMKELTICKGAA